MVNRWISPSALGFNYSAFNSIQTSVVFLDYQKEKLTTFDVKSQEQPKWQYPQKPQLAVG